MKEEVAKGRNVGEYDGYVIPPFDPTIPPEERERLKKEADRELEIAIQDALEDNEQQSDKHAQ